MVKDAKPGGRTEGDTEVAGAESHRDVSRRVAGADRFAIPVPGIGRVPIPRPDQLAFYGALAALVAVELVEWPVAVAIGAGHALLNRQESSSKPDEP
jgi:hypothetical protein